MRTVLIHLAGLVSALVLYYLLEPNARTELLSNMPLGEKLAGIGVRGFCIYACALFVYYAVFRARQKTPMPDEGAYGGYADPDDEADQG